VGITTVYQQRQTKTRRKWGSSETATTAARICGVAALIGTERERTGQIVASGDSQGPILTCARTHKNPRANTYTHRARTFLVTFAHTHIHSHHAHAHTLCWPYLHTSHVGHTHTHLMLAIPTHSSCWPYLHTSRHPLSSSAQVQERERDRRHDVLVYPYQHVPPRAKEQSDKSGVTELELDYHALA
jgi:hypothetical protein